MPFVLNTLNVPSRHKVEVFLQVAIKNTTAIIFDGGGIVCPKLLPLRQYWDQRRLDVLLL